MRTRLLLAIVVAVAVLAPGIVVVLHASEDCHPISCHSWDYFDWEYYFFECWRPHCADEGVT